MSIAEKIKDVINTYFPTWGCIYDDWYSADTTLTKTSLPAFLVLMPNGGELELKNSKMYHTQNIAVAIVEREERDANGDDNDVRIEDTINVASQFIIALNQSGYFDKVSLVTYSTIYEQLSSIVTGVLLQLSLTDTGVCWSVSPPEPDDEDDEDDEDDDNNGGE